MNILRPVVTLALLLLVAGVAAAQEKISFDVKTKLLEKPVVTAAKNGTLLFLLESDWAGVAELGEDYALWIRNARRTVAGDSITLTLNVELRSSSLFGEGELLASRTVAVTYDPEGDWKVRGTPEAVKVVETVEQYGGYAVAVAKIFYPISTAVAEIGVDMLIPGDTNQMNMEAMTAGQSIVAVAREMVEEEQGRAVEGPKGERPEEAKTGETASSGQASE